MQKQDQISDPAAHPQALLAEALDSRSHRKRSSSRLHIDPVTLVADAGAIDETLDPPPDRFAASNAGALGTRLHELAIQADLTRSEFFEVIVQFDELEGWRTSGARNCVGWMIDELEFSRSFAYEQYKSAKELQTLPTIARHFASGKLTWCKVRALLRIATPEDEKALAITALDLDADAVRRFCDDYRFGKDQGSDAERDKAQRARRSVTYSRRADGSITMQVVLPPESGAEVIRSLEHREELLFDSPSEKERSSDETRPTAAQRRADSLVAMAQASLGGAANSDADGSAASSKADRHLVVTHIDAEALASAELEIASEPRDSDAPLPTPVRAAIAGILNGSISPATARRLACEGSLVTMIMNGGEPVAVGRRHRLHTSAQRRAILTRDAGCTFPGCGATRHLDVHHVTLWRDGGKTSVREATTLCKACHVRVHDEGWRITRLPDAEPIARHPDAQALLDGADERTKAITRLLDARRSPFRFERPGATQGPDALGVPGVSPVSGVPDMPDMPEATDLPDRPNHERGRMDASQKVSTAGDASAGRYSTGRAPPICCNESPGVYRVHAVDRSRRFAARSGTARAARDAVSSAFHWFGCTPQRLEPDSNVRVRHQRVG